MKKKLHHVLVNTGLTEKEANIYLALLELGEASILKLSRATKLNRASLYYIMEKMIERGLVTKLTKKSGDFFTPINPKLWFSQEKTKVHDLEKIIPELMGLQNKIGQRPQVSYFEGIENVKAIYADSLQAKTDILNYANSREVRTYWPEYDEEYVKKRAKNKIWLRGIAPDDDYGRRVQNEDQNFYREIRLINKRKLDFNNEIMIYDHKIATITFAEEVFGVIIESREVSKTNRAIFEMAWNFAGKKLK